MKGQSQSEIGIDSNLTSMHEGQFVTVLLPTLRHDAHQKHDSHNRKCICFATFVAFVIIIIRVSGMFVKRIINISICIIF